MATVTQQPPQPHGEMLDYEQYIDHQLRLTRSRIKMTDVLTASVALASAALAVLFLEVLLDHAIGLPRLVRQVILLGGLAGGGYFAATRIARPLLWSVNGLYAARTIEDADPAFKNSLMNYLDLRRHRADVPASYLAAVEARAVGDLTRVEIDSVVNQRRLIQTSYALAAVVVVASLYLLMTPKSIVDSVRRASWPTWCARRTRDWWTSSRATTPSFPGSWRATRSPSRSTCRGRGPPGSSCTTAWTAASSSPTPTSRPARTASTPGPPPCRTCSRMSIIT